MKEIKANEARAICESVLNSTDLKNFKEDIMKTICDAAAEGKYKVYYFFDDDTPDNVKTILQKWLSGLGYEANIPIADKFKIRISWKENN